MEATSAIVVLGWFAPFVPTQIILSDPIVGANAVVHDPLEKLDPLPEVEVQV
jgi:hypothetical protein